MIDLAADFDIPGHLRRRSHVVHGQCRGGLQRLCVAGGAGKGMVRRGLLTVGIDVTHLLNDLKQTGASGDAIGLQGRGHSQTDGLLRAAHVGYHQIRGHGIQAALHAFHGGVKGFQVNGNIRAVGHGASHP